MLIMLKRKRHRLLEGVERKPALWCQSLVLCTTRHPNQIRYIVLFLLLLLRDNSHYSLTPSFVRRVSLYSTDLKFYDF